MELNLCMRCMKELGKGETVCPFCGFDAGKQTAAPHNLPYGSVLNGRYMTGAVLGEGGFGVTYIGYELNLGIRIAIKEFYPFGFVGRESTQSLSVRSYSNAADFFAQGKEKFLKEARSIAQFMKLPGIVTVRDFFLENNTAYIVMDYIEGTSLKQYAQGRKGKIPSEELLPLLQPIVQSLIEVHERGVIHRDISPDNILIDTDGKAWLIDFGAAREVSPEGERTLSVTLKKGYTPEEQYRTHGEQGPWTDVYSMCATIYAMLTGVKPDEPFDRLEEETLRPPRTLGASLTERQEETLLKGLAIRAKDRLQSMEEVYNGLYTQSATEESTPTAEWDTRTKPSAATAGRTGTETPAPGRKPSSGTSASSGRPKEDIVAQQAAPASGKKAWGWAIGFAALMGACSTWMLFFVDDAWQYKAIWFSSRLNSGVLLRFLCLFTVVMLTAIVTFYALKKKQAFTAVGLYLGYMICPVLIITDHTIFRSFQDYTGKTAFVLDYLQCEDYSVLIATWLFFALIVLTGYVSGKFLKKKGILLGEFLFLVGVGLLILMQTRVERMILDPFMNGFDYYGIFGEIIVELILPVCLLLLIMFAGHALGMFFRRKLGLFPIPANEK